MTKKKAKPAKLKEKKPMGRPAHKLTKALTNELCQLLGSGNYVEPACAYVGLPVRTFYNWMTWGREEVERCEDPEEKADKSKKKYVEFWHAITRARSQAEIKGVERIRMIASGRIKRIQINDKKQTIEVYEDVDARTALDAEKFFLERGRADRWGRRTVSVEHSGPGGGPIEIHESPVDLGRLNDEELEQLLELRRKLDTGGTDEDE